MGKNEILLTALALTSGCAEPRPLAPSAPELTPPPSVPFDYVGQSWMRVPARLADGPETHLMLDTGMGITLLTPEACQRAGCIREGTWSGQRMSGQTIELALARIPSLTVAGHRVENARVAIFASDDVIHRDLGVDGIAGLDVFADQPVTFDHRAMRVILESPPSLAARRASGREVPVRVKRDGPSVEVYLPLDLGDGARAEMEVDSGSFDMILDDRFMAALGIDPEGATVKREDGRDETAHPYVRRFTRLPRAVRVASAPAIEVAPGATVMFQKIIHDGLLGQSFLRAHVVTFDVPDGAMVFER